MNGPKLWIINGSFFWRQLIKISTIFHWSTVWCIGNGMSISYWYDAWAGMSLADLGPGRYRPEQPSISLADAFSIAHVLAPEDDKLKELQLNQNQDYIMWKWDGKAVYTAKSSYMTMVGGGKTKWPFMEIWSSKAPQTVKFFAVMMLKDKLLSHEVMERRHIHCELKCVVCNDCPKKSSLHLLFLCAYATHVWFIVSNMLGYRLMHQAMTVQDIWLVSREARGGKKKKEWVTQFMCTLWSLWKHRNEVVFGGTRVEPRILAERIVQDCELWMKHG